MYQKIMSYQPRLNLESDYITSFNQAINELDSIGYGGIKPDPNGDCLFIPFTTGSDYSGTTVELSNYRAIYDDYKDKLLKVHGGYSTFGLLVSRVDYENDPEIQELFDQLESYPVYDDDHLSQLEQELLDDTWDCYMKYDLSRELDSNNIAYDDDNLESIYWQALYKAIDDGNAYPIYESNGVPFIRIEELLPYVIELL